MLGKCSTTDRLTLYFVLFNFFGGIGVCTWGPILARLALLTPESLRQALFCDFLFLCV
jgi:hypothetical protein